MKRYILALFLAFLAFHLTAQSFEWVVQEELDYEFNPDMIQYNTCANPQGGCYFYGIQEHVSFYTGSMGVLFLKKYSEEGSEIWSKSITGQSEVKGMACDDNGDVYISGQILTDADFWGEDTLVKLGIGTDGFIARVNNSGDLEWCINLTNLGIGEGTVSELVLHNQELYVGYSNWMNSYVLIFSEGGEYIDAVVQENVNLISGMDIDDEGNLYTCGSCAGWQATFGGESYPAPFSYTTYLVKYNPAFEPVWVKYIEDITCTFPQVRVDNEGWIYFAGPLMINALFDDIQLNGPSWVYDFFLARLNPEGQYQWVNESPEVTTGDATVGSTQFLDLDQEGNVLMTGITRGVVDWGEGVFSDVTGNYQDLITWNYSPAGAVNWVKTAGGTGYEQVHSISTGSGNLAYIAGVNSGISEFDSITIQSTGLADPFLALLNIEIETGTDEPGQPEDIKIYPNPAKDRLYVQSGIVLGKYRVYNISGQQVMHDKLLQDQMVINIQALPVGYYIFKFETEDLEVVEIPVILKY